MTKACRRISQVMLFAFLLFLTGNISAQQALVLPQNPKMEMAKERFEATHEVDLTDAEFTTKLATNDSNLLEWNAVLASFSRDEIATQLQTNPVSLTRTGAKSDSDYFYIRNMVVRMQRELN